mmetsp:Transcript_13786/g.19271  ORF Transcript_13786/g.19271 Transcript_13786/m.19271 type:complete len:918 (+) Transcript_13786:223-2976(+)
MSTEMENVNGTKANGKAHRKASIVAAQYSPNKWTKFMHTYVHKPVQQRILSVSRHAAVHPQKYVVCTIVLSLAIVVLGLFTNFTVEDRESELYPPFGARSLQHEDWIQDESGFPKESRGMTLSVHSDGNDVLGQEGSARVFEVINAIRSLEGYNPLCSKSKLGRVDYETGEPTCPISAITQFWNHSIDFYQSTVSSDDDAISAMSEEFYPDGEPVDTKNIIGRAERDKTTNLLTLGQSYLVNFFLPADTDDIEDEAEVFEQDVIDMILEKRKEWKQEDGNPFRVELFTDRSFGDEFDRAIETDLTLVPLVFIIMSVFCVLVFSRKDSVRSRGMLGFGAVISVLLSLFTAYGIMFIIGVPLTSFTQILPFIMFGIGIDDVFVIIGEYERLGHIVDPVDRISETMESVGISITITTLTSILAFASGCASSIPVVYWICLYAFLTVFFIYLYAITFFVSLTVLDERRLQGNRRGCLVCFVAKNNDEDNPDEEEDGNDHVVNPTTELPLAERFMRWYSKKLMNKGVKIFVLVSFTALFAGLAYSASQMEVYFNFTDVLPGDSYVTDLVDANAAYSEQTSVNPYIYFRDVDQSDESIQIQMQQYVDQLVTDVDVIDVGPTFFWLNDFQDFINTTEGMGDLTFLKQLDAFLEDPIYNVLYVNDIVRNDETGEILDSRCQVQMPGILWDEIQTQLDALLQQRSVSKEQEVNQDGGDWSFFTFNNNYFLWDFYAVVVDELILSTVLGVVMVTVIALILMPHISGFLFVGPFIAVLYIDLLGVLQLAGISIGPVSYIGLVMSIGLMVDYVVHIVLRYFESTVPDREGKVIDTLASMGSSVFVGGLSTLLGVIPLALSSTDIFITVFVTFSGLVVLGMSHGLILLPVVLSIVGPAAETMPQEEGRADEEDDGDDEKLDKDDLVDGDN